MCHDAFSFFPRASDCLQHLFYYSRVTREHDYDSLSCWIRRLTGVRSRPVCERGERLSEHFPDRDAGRRSRQEVAKRVSETAGASS